VLCILFYEPRKSINIIQDKIDDVNIVVCFICKTTNLVNDACDLIWTKVEYSVVVTTPKATGEQATISNRSKKATSRGRAI
jgi:hypothetical protein